MQSPPEIQVLETYREVPIVGLSYPEPTLLTREIHLAEIRALSGLPCARFAVVASYRNLSYSSEYGPREMAKFYQSPEFQDLQDRILTVVRCHPGSLTSMVHTMSAHTLIRGGSSNFAPDVESALRLVRREVDRALVEQRHP